MSTATPVSPPLLSMVSTQSVLSQWTRSLADHLRRPVKHHAAVPGIHESQHRIGARSSKTDHAELHRESPL